MPLKRFAFSPKLVRIRYDLAIAPTRPSTGSARIPRGFSRFGAIGRVGTVSANECPSSHYREEYTKMSTRAMSMQSSRTTALVAYVLHLLGAIAGLPSIIGLILNYMSRGSYSRWDVASTHHSWMIRSFWWALLWVVIGVLTTWLLIGWVICGIAWLWYVYRHVRGVVALVNGEPLPR
jgi:uncharacterized membrane protein